MTRLNVTDIAHSFLLIIIKIKPNYKNRTSQREARPIFAPVSLVLWGHRVAVQGTETNPISTFKTREMIKMNFIVAKEMYQGVKVAATTV